MATVEDTSTDRLAAFHDAQAINDACDELKHARLLHGPFASAHEGYAVVLEEVRELEAEVFKRQSMRSRDQMRAEAIQIAAMALRFAADLTPRDIPT